MVPCSHSSPWVSQFLLSPLQQAPACQWNCSVSDRVSKVGIFSSTSWGSTWITSQTSLVQWRKIQLPCALPSCCFCKIPLICSYSEQRNQWAVCSGNGTEVSSRNCRQMIQKIQVIHSPSGDPGLCGKKRCPQIMLQIIVMQCWQVWRHWRTQVSLLVHDTEESMAEPGTQYVHLATPSQYNKIILPIKDGTLRSTGIYRDILTNRCMKSGLMHSNFGDFGEDAKRADRSSSKKLNLQVQSC